MDSPDNLPPIDAIISQLYALKKGERMVYQYMVAVGSAADQAAQRRAPILAVAAGLHAIGLVNLHLRRGRHGVEYIAVGRGLNRRQVLRNLPEGKDVTNGVRCRVAQADRDVWDSWVAGGMRVYETGGERLRVETNAEGLLFLPEKFEEPFNRYCYDMRAREGTLLQGSYFIDTGVAL